MISGDRPTHLLSLVSLAGIFALLSFALWPVFLTSLGREWGLSNTDIGLVSGAYFFGYLLATPILVGLTDRIDAKLIFLGGCAFGVFGCLGFAQLAHDFWSAASCWALVGAGLAGTYMPGLQILNARLDDAARVRSVPWYTACFGIGTGSSFGLMGVLLAYADWRLAAYLGAGGAMLGAMLVLFLVQPRPVAPLPATKTKRHPLDLRPAFRKPVALGYILAYGTHTYELFAFRTWSFALLVFLASRADGSMGIGAVTTIVSLITVTGMLASLLGARLCLAFGRHRMIALIGGATALVSVIVAFSLDGPVWIAVAGLWIYNGFIMLDSGALTTGTVEAGDAYDRGALLAVHSMIGFGGGALGAPVVGYVLDQAGGASMIGAWFYALLAMGAGSAIVFAVQRHFWRRIG
ncbi:MFS transporter [Alphaproteobacteria bacterium]|nr:MFS transporter [Alphaproteobacteria bacterium]